MESVGNWLQRLGLGEYVPLFEQQRIAPSHLADLTEADLKEIGVVALGDRKVLLKAIEALKCASNDAIPAQTISPISDGQHHGERRQLTVLFCDLAGFTQLANQLDPEELQAVIRSYENLCAGAIARFEGYVYQRLGDGIVAYFGYPLAHEGEAERAIRAAIEIIDSIAGHPQPATGPLHVRIGIATGVVVVSRTGDQGAIGDTMNLASRLQGIAPLDNIVISELTRQLAAGVFEYEDLGERELKGIPAAIQVWRVLGVSTSATRFDAATRDGLTPLVGREQEIALLLERWQRARDGDGQVVLLSGEPGIGKSRMLRAFLDQLSDAAVTILRFQCSPFKRHSPLHPVADTIERRLGFTRGDTPVARLSKLETWVCAENQQQPLLAQLLANMMAIPDVGRYPALSTTPQRQKEDTLHGIVDLIDSIARREATLMLFEDAHWADPSTLDLLSILIDRIRATPILVIITFRPELQPRWTEHLHISTLAVTRLSRAQITALIDKVTEKKALPSPLVEQIAARTDGVPLFVEELTKAVLESNLVKDTGDHYELIGNPATIVIPATLHDSLMARLDRLQTAKEIAQIGAALGREFSYEMLSAVVSVQQSALDKALSALTASGLVFQRGFGANASFVFKHALVQDAAYESMLKSTRQALHAKIAKVIKERFAELALTQPELLAHHCALSCDIEQAISCWRAAAKMALARSALEEAIAHLDRALSATLSLPTTPDLEDIQLTLHMNLGSAWMMRAAWQDEMVGKHFRAASEIAERLRRDDLLGPIYWLVTANILTNGRIAGASEWISKAEQLAQTSQRRESLQLFRLTMSCFHFFHGDFMLAVRHAEACLAHHRDEDTPYFLEIIQQETSIEPKVYLAHAYWMLGYPDKAMQFEVMKNEEARALGHPFILGFALGFGAYHLTFRRDSTMQEERAAECDRIGREYGMPFFSEVDARAHRGHAAIASGRYQEGVGHLSRIFTLPNLPEIFKPFNKASLAIGEAQLGNLDRAFANIQEAIDQIERPGWEERLHYAEVLRVKGWIQKLKEQPEAAEATLQQSLQVARSQSAKSWELRTATTLAQLYADHGRQEEAIALLQSIYDWFTEGFDTPDLVDAKELLMALR